MTKKKRVGTKARIRAEKGRERRIAMAIFLALILLIVAFSVYFTYSFLNPPQYQIIAMSSGLRAAIVDQVSLTFPNQTFVQTATDMLEQANYTVDYYSGENVTVEFYRNLPTHGYDLMILRVHSTLTNGELFTSEPYSSTEYVSEQLADQVLKFSFDGNAPYYFGIGIHFVESTMEGRFKNTTIIMMGCNGLKNTDMAHAFIERGAKIYISWSRSVQASHTDQVTARLLQHLVTEGQTIKQAVENSMKEVGPDPQHNTTLEYYPPESGD